VWTDAVLINIRSMPAAACRCRCSSIGAICVHRHLQGAVVVPTHPPAPKAVNDCDPRVWAGHLCLFLQMCELGADPCRDVVGIWSRSG